MDPNVIICFPYSYLNEDREKSAKSTYEYYKKLGYNIFYGTSDPFYRSSARNGAVPDFFDYDLILFLDSDIIVPLDQIKQAIIESFKNQEMVLTYTDLHVLNKNQTELFYKNNTFSDSDKIYCNQTSGSFVIPKKLWFQLNGQDERFKTWGGEDRSFYYACSLVQKNEIKHIPGKAYHLYHPRDTVLQSHLLKNNSLFSQYTGAYTNKDLNMLQDLLNQGNLNENFSSNGYPHCPEFLGTEICFKNNENIALNQQIDSPLVCVSIATYNAKKRVNKAIQSVLNQTFKNFILFVLFDGQLQKDIQYLDDFNDSRLHFIDIPKNIGRYAVDHLFLTKIVPMFSSLKYWAPHDADDMAEKDWLQKLVTCMQIKKPNLILTDQKVIGKRTIIELAKTWDKTDTFAWHGHLSGLWDISFLLENNLTNYNYRIGWDSIMTSVPFLLGNVEIIHSPLYTRIKTPNSLTKSKETGQGSPLRKKVQSHLRNVWKELVSCENKREIQSILRRERCIQLI